MSSYFRRFDNICPVLDYGNGTAPSKTRTDREGVFDVLYLHPVAADDHTDHIEATNVIAPPVPSGPHFCRPNQLTLLSPVHRTYGPAECCVRPGLYLDEYDHATRTAFIPTDDNEVYIAVTVAEAPPSNLPAV